MEFYIYVVSAVGTWRASIVTSQTEKFLVGDLCTIAGKPFIETYVQPDFHPNFLSVITATAAGWRWSSVH